MGKAGPRTPALPPGQPRLWAARRRDSRRPMVRALGYSHSPFDPTDPGRLCRGRERWIESFPTEPDELPRLWRVCISGAAFSDDSARDARRGLRFSGLSPGQVARALFPNSALVVWAEDAHPGRVPSRAEGVEYYALRQPGGPLRQDYARWSMVCADAASLDEAFDAGADALLALEPPAPTRDDEAPSPLVDAPAADAHLDPSHRGGLPEPLREALFLLTGFRVDGAPARAFQAAALPPLLARCRAVVLLHQDKHAHCLGVYANRQVDLSRRLDELARGVGALSVPFAIPPMLARWDRALWEVRQAWDERQDGEYPVPPATDGGSGWSRRGARRGPGVPDGEE